MPYSVHTSRKIYIILVSLLLFVFVAAMETTKLSNEGQVIIPEALRKAYGWEIGQELIVVEMGDGILLKPKQLFPETTLNDVAGCLKYQGTPKTLEDMENAIRQSVEELWHDCS